MRPKIFIFLWTTLVLPPSPVIPIDISGWFKKKNMYRTCWFFQPSFLTSCFCSCCMTFCSTLFLYCSFACQMACFTFLLNSFCFRCISCLNTLLSLRMVWAALGYLLAICFVDIIENVMLLLMVGTWSSRLELVLRNNS